MKRRASILALGLLLGLVLLLGLRPWGLALGTVERHVIGAIEERTGLKVTRLAGAEIALLPLPRVSLKQLRFVSAGGGFGGEAPRLRARMRIAPLLLGRLSFDRIELVAPRLEAETGDAGTMAWIDAGAQRLAKLPDQSRILISGGSIVLRGPGKAVTEISGVNLVLDGRSAGEPIALAGSFSWRDVETGVTVLWPVVGERAPASFTATSRLMNMSFEGNHADGGPTSLAGKLRFETPSLPVLLDWIGRKPLLAAALGPVTLNASARLGAQEVALSNVSATLGEDRLDGVLTLASAAGRWSISGTLAGATLDLGSAAARLGLAGPARDTDSPQPIPFAALTAADVDLRVSAETARFGQARVSEAATYLLVRPDRFEAGLIRAGAYGGSAKGRLLAVAAAPAVDVKLQAALERVDLAKLGADLTDLPRISGIGSAQLLLEGLGASIDRVIANASGKLTLSLRQGEFIGASLPDLAARAERGAGGVPRDWRRGRTAYDSLNLTAIVSGGVALFSEGQMSGQGFRLGLTGQASLLDGTIRMDAALSPANGGFALPFALHGPVLAPQIEPGPRGGARSGPATDPAP